MNTDKCFCHLNGYAVKDATARAQIAALQETITAQSQTITELQETITALDTAYNNLIVVTESFRSRIDALEAAVAELSASGGGSSLMIQKINIEQA